MQCETVVRPGRREYSYYRCPGRRDRTCDAGNVYVEDADAAVIEHIAEGVLTADLVALARDELKMRTSRRRR